jgi:serine/threonine-protein kinase
VQATAVGQIVGTPAFLAPEAAMGEKAVDHRADIYALGCVGYWMLTGQYVFAETSAIAMAVAHVTKTPELPSRRVDRAIVPQLETVIMSCLRKNRDERPRSAEALRQALSEVPLGDSWSRERALAWWQQNLAAKSASPA